MEQATMDPVVSGTLRGLAIGAGLVILLVIVFTVFFVLAYNKKKKQKK